MAKRKDKLKTGLGKISEEKKERVQLLADALPRRTLEHAVIIAKTLHETYAGKSATLEELAETIKIAAKSTNMKYLIWSALAYGIIKKDDGNSYSLSEVGRKIVAPTYDKENIEGIRKAILTPTIMSKFYSDYNGHTIPAPAHFPNVLEAKYEVPRDRIEEAIKIISDNAKYAEIFEEPKTVDQQPSINLTGLGVVVKTPTGPKEEGEHEGAVDDSALVKEKMEWDKIIFYITPIGDEGTEVRKHADMMLKHLLEPVAGQFNMKVTRADKIERSGLITQQIFEHLVNSRLCIADLSFNNPNAFYELGVRHTCKLSTIQVIRKGDKIPFDVSQGRTITVDTSDVYTVMDRMESAKRELSEHLKSALTQSQNEAADDNPVKVYLPGLKVNLS